jgi:peptidoglycan/LPS O-acetylase OafA/YrhL
VGDSGISVRSGATDAQKRYVNLDGLRGVAALAVCFWHAHQLGIGNLPSAYLGVDLFFLMSGFVLDAAYSKRLETNLSPGKFMLIRVVRLYPLYILGTLALLVYFLIARHSGANDIFSSTYLFSAFALGALFLPIKSANPTYFLFPLSPPAWSLFLELIVNYLYTIKIIRKNNKFMLVAIAISAILMIVSAAKFGTLDLGWNVSTFPWGVPRVIFSFFAGVILFRISDKWEWNSFIHPIFLPVLTVLMLSVPAGGVFQGFSQVGIILLGFPFLVFISIKCDTGPKLTSVYKWAGELSYPLYALHVPVIRWLNGALQAVHIQPKETWWAGWLGMALAVAASGVALVVYDRWARSKLSRLFGLRRS